jgi:hypothetical protein
MRPPAAVISALILTAALSPAPLVAQSDLDAFMAKVLARRDDNWKKLQQYILDEDETFDLTGPGGVHLYGFRREYTWFIKLGLFVRSPIKVDGVAIAEADRRKAEADWIAREQTREERRRKRAELEAAGKPGPDDPSTITVSPRGVEVEIADVLRQSGEPRFVSSAYFLRFRFENGRYALAGREPIEARQALRIEYYPREGLFKEGRTRPNKEVRRRDEEIEDKMNKVSQVTLWVDPETYQILQYTFDDIDMDFMPGRALVRIDDLQASMRMGQMFPNVWLPRNIEMRFRMTLAVGAVDAVYHVDYHDYRQADVTVRIK